MGDVIVKILVDALVETIFKKMSAANYYFGDKNYFHVD